MDESGEPKPANPLPLEYRGKESAAGEISSRRLWSKKVEKSIKLLVLVVLVALVVWGGIDMMLRPSPAVLSLRAMCSSNLKNIAYECVQYSNTHNGSYPADFQDMLLSGGMTSQTFVCPATNDTPAQGTPAQQAAQPSGIGHVSYIYLGKNLTSSSPANAVLAYEPLSNHNNTGMNVLFNDYHTQWLPAAEAQKLIDSIVQGKPTVWPPPGGKL